MRIKILIPILAILLGACNFEVPVDSDQNILDIVYNGPRTPAGFYIEHIPNDTFYIRRHIKNNGYEVSALDYDDALNWDANSTGQLIEITETEWYYQFSHIGDAPTFVNLDRVFKADIINRTGAELNCENCYQGTVNPLWATAQDVKK